MGFKFGKKSLIELEGVHPDLAKVVNRALMLSAQDFGVHDGLRTLEEQKKYVAAGVSQTLESRHLTGHAVDLVPYINGKLRWEWGPIYVIADAVRKAARELQIPIRWGGAWDELLTDSDQSPEEMLSAYTARRKAAGHRAFIDGPHFELPKAIYPN